MTQRVIKDATGDLYDHHSEACHTTLKQLGEFLDSMGFKVHKKAAAQAVLRVYLEGRKYPLLNPRFERLGRKEVLEVTVLSRSLGDTFDHALGTFPSSNQCTFIPEISDRRTYRLDLHGFFLIPLSFSGEPGGERVDFGALKGGLIQIRDFLQQNTKDAEPTKPFHATRGRGART